MRALQPKACSKGAQMHTFIAWITPRDGIARRYALTAAERCEAIAKAHALGRALHGANFSFSVREAA
jgi:hypothetical protein